MQTYSGMSKSWASSKKDMPGNSCDTQKSRETSAVCLNYVAEDVAGERHNKNVTSEEWFHLVVFLSSERIMIALLLLSLPTILTISKLFWVWLVKYKLRYTLRITTVFFIFFLLLDLVCSLLCTYDVAHILRVPVNGEFRQYIYFATLLSGAMFLTMIVVRYHWNMPLDIKRNVNSREYNHLKCPIVKYTNIERIIHNRVDQGNPEFMPPVYTNGWIPLVESRSLSKGDVIPVEAIGQRFCVYRTEEGKAHIVDPYCPHLGADLSVGGCVVGDNIQCPFHGWQFSGEDGVCRGIPYANKVPDIAKTKVWPTSERNGYIFVWYHAEDCSPDWEMPSIPDVEDGRWVFRGRTEHEAKCHIQEIPENGADVAHLHHLHSRSVFLGSQNAAAGALSLWNLVANVWHEWEPVWEPDDERRHVARMQLKQRTRIGRFNVPFSSLTMNIEQIGPATVHMHMETSFGKAVLLQHITPLAPFRQKIVHLLYTEPSFKQFPADLFILAEAVMLERDIEIWNNKKFLKYPIILKEDSFIRKYRRWYSQFYSANSPKLQDVKKSMLDW